MSILYKKNLSVMSYNIWFSEYERNERLKSLIYIVNKENPDVLCLQEVLSNEYEKLKLKLNYDYYFPNSIEEGTYGCVIFSKYNIVKSKIIKLPSKMDRNLLISQININFKCGDVDEFEKMVITNTHFESEFSTTSNPTKEQQYKFVSAILNKLFKDYGNVILCSDTNVTKIENEFFNKVFIGMGDAWIDTGSDQNNEYTYDNVTNKNLKFRNIVLRSRIDKILYKNKGSTKPINFKLITGIENMIQPSDHHGILSTFEIMHAYFKV